MRGRGVLAAALLALVAPIVTTAVAHAGTDTDGPGIVVTTPSPGGYTSYAGFRLQAVGASGPTFDEYLGVADLSPAANRIEMNFSPASFAANGNAGSTSGDCVGNYAVGSVATPSSNNVTFTWDAAAGTLTSRLVDATLSCTLVFRNVAQELANAKGWTLARAQTALTDVNALRVMADDRQPGSLVTLTGGTVDGSVGLGAMDPGRGASTTWLGTGYDFDAPNGFSFAGTVNLGGTFGSCESTCALEVTFGHFTPPNRAPVVRDAAPDASGHRGDALRTSGSFTDPDGDPLTIGGSGAGTLTDNGDGTWSWRYVPRADGSDAVSVTASDGKGGTATDAFTWTAEDQPPAVLDHAADATGSEGDTLTTHGSFTDPDGDPLAIGGSGDGIVTDNHDGTWSWQHVPADDDGGSVTVTASDGNGGTATDTFAWTATNVPPTIVSLTPSATTVLAGADVTWTVVATDPGTDDTFTWWFDGGAGVAGDLTTTYTTSYQTCGSNTLDAKVADDDGGSDHTTSDATVTVVEAAATSPLETDGVNLVQKGQVVPIKVTVGCGADPLSELHPTVELGLGGHTYPAESVSSADTPGTMRWTEDGYQYNLRVPRSLGGRALAMGDLVTVLVEPFGDGGGALEIVLQIRK
jgi:Bacterial Ig domain